MLRTAIALILTAGLAVLACGDQQGAGTETGDETGNVSSGRPPAAVETIEAIEIEEEVVEMDPKVATCLGLIAEGDFAAAMPACQLALGVDPDNTEVQAALSQAKTEVASAQADAAAATARAAADSAIQGGADDAASALEGAAGGLPGN